jgi:hypothetical protein
MSVTSVEAAMPICTPKLCNYGYPNEAGVAHDCNQTGLGIVTGKTCLAYCATGYELEASVVDDYTFMCLAYGMLNGTQPNCKLKLCNSLVVDASYIASSCYGRSYRRLAAQRHRHG